MISRWLGEGRRKSPIEIELETHAAPAYALRRVRGLGLQELYAWT